MSDKLPTVTDIEENTFDLMGNNKVETVIKEIFNKKNLPFITELTFDQIVEVCKLKHIAEKYGEKNFPDLNKKYPIEKVINIFIENFMLYMCSHKRKRISEFLTGLKSDRNNAESKPNLFSKLKL